jgi:hypothetical protein
MAVRDSINFLPTNLRDASVTPLFPYVSEVLDWIISQYHTTNIDKLRGLYDPTHPEYDPDYILDLLGSTFFATVAPSAEQKKAMCMMVANLYQMKGTRRGLSYILRLLSMDADVFEWYWVNRQFDAGDPAWPEEIPECSIIIEVKNQPGSSLPDDAEVRFAILAGYLLWICVILHEIRWKITFEEFYETQHGIDDVLIITPVLAFSDGDDTRTRVYASPPVPPEAYDNPQLPYIRYGEGGQVYGKTERDPLGAIHETQVYAAVSNTAADYANPILPYIRYNEASKIYSG